MFKCNWLIAPITQNMFRKCIRITIAVHQEICTFAVPFARHMPTELNGWLVELDCDWFVCVFGVSIYTSKEAPIPQSNIIQYTHIIVSMCKIKQYIDWSVRRSVTKSISIRWLDECIESRLLPKPKRLNTHHRQRLIFNTWLVLPGTIWLVFSQS